MTTTEPHTPGRRRSWLPFLAAGVVAALVLVVGVLVAGGGSEEEQPDHGSIAGVTLAAFPEDGTVELDAFLGKPLVLNYWASWCAPCIQEMPGLQSVYEQVGDQVEFLGVNIQDAPEQAERLIEVTGVRYPLASDPVGDWFQEIGGIGMPTTLFVDEEGTIRERFTGTLDERELQERISRHFGI